MAWMIDGTNTEQMSPEMINLRGIEVVTMKNYISFLPSYSFQSSLNITANCINNYTTVQCLMSNCIYKETSNASLKVEGIKPNYFYYKFTTNFVRLYYFTTKNHNHWTKLGFIALGCIQC